MTLGVRWCLGACAVLVVIDTAAQTLPPANPSMGPPVTATMHANAASSNATTNPGPVSGAVSISGRSFDAVFPTILMGSDGLIVSVATKWSDLTMGWQSQTIVSAGEPRLSIAGCSKDGGFRTGRLPVAAVRGRPGAENTRPCEVMRSAATRDKLQ